MPYKKEQMYDFIGVIKIGHNQYIHILIVIQQVKIVVIAIGLKYDRTTLKMNQ